MSVPPAIRRAPSPSAPVRSLMPVLLPVLLLVLTVVPAFPAPIPAAPAPAPPLPGRPAPDFAAVDIEGARVHLAALRGRLVVLEWTSPACPFTRKHYRTGNMQRLQRETTEEHGAVWISIVSSAPGRPGYLTPAEARRLTARRGAYASHVILDPQGRIARLYHARTTPHMFVIAPDGTLAYMGAIDDRATVDPADVKVARNHVRESVAAIMAGRPVPHPSTRPYGCPVHYSGG